MNTAQVLIVSAYGRGHWLAVASAQLGLSVILLDVSEKLGSWIPEDVEGPFGIFQNEKMAPLAAERLLEGDSPTEVKNGFTLWLRSGPVEFKGPTTAHRLRQLAVRPEVEAYLQNPTAETKKKLASLSFEDQWLAQIAHAWSANDYFVSPSSTQTLRAASLFGPFSVRFPSRQGHHRSLEWCRRHGVQVIEKANIRDLSLLDRSNLKGVEYQEDQSEKTQILEGKQVVWCLSSEETGMLGARVQQLLFPRGPIEPEWIWSRYRIKISEGAVRTELPLHVVLIDDLGRPWTHENLMILLRTGSPDFFDLWMRLPAVQRFNKSYLELRGEEMIASLQHRLHGHQIEIANYPSGYEFTYNQAGPARQPVYNPQARAEWHPCSLQNVWFDSAEQRSGLGWNSEIDRQQEILAGIRSWWEKIQMKQKKNLGVEA